MNNIIFIFFQELLLEFSEMMKDYVRVIQQHIQNKRYEKALMVLRNQRFVDTTI